MRPLIVLPSYNESQNLVRLIGRILELHPEARVCVVDDSSPDGTAELVRQAIAERTDWSERVHLIVRAKKDGRGGAVRDGFAWGIEQRAGFDAFVEMDCDFSHEPEAIGQGLALLADGADFVIGARYPDGTIVGWPFGRRAFSFLANTLARALIDWSIADYTNGFRFYSTKAIDELLGRPQKHRGYIYLSETLSHAVRAGLKVRAFPIVFRNRERGDSNTNLSEIRAALQGILSIAWNHHTRRR